MKRHRLGAWIGQESIVDKKTGERKKCESWTVKYDAFDRKPGERRQRAERGFASEADAIAWWVLQKQNQHRPVAKAEAVKEAPITLEEFLDRWLKTSKGALSAGAYRQYESHVRKHLRPSLGSAFSLIWSARLSGSRKRWQRGTAKMGAMDACRPASPSQSGAR